jgi:hypothetical protein
MAAPPTTEANEAGETPGQFQPYVPDDVQLHNRFPYHDLRRAFQSSAPLLRLSGGLILLSSFGPGRKAHGGRRIYSSIHLSKVPMGSVKGNYARQAEYFSTSSAVSRFQASYLM